METKKPIKAAGWTREIKISSEKYEPIAEAILNVLTSSPTRFGQLVQKVQKKLPNFPGSVEWYTITVLRDLENQGKVERTKGKVVTYAKV